MKKLVLVSMTILMVVLGATLVFAAAPDTQAPAGSGFSMDKMIDACKQVVNNFVKDGTLTPDQGKAMNDQMNNMAPMMKDMMGDNNPNMMGPGMMGGSTNPMGQSGMMGQGAANQGMPCYDSPATK